MTLLPIADREPRVASRQGATYWTRVGAAGIAILVSGGFLAVWTTSAMAFGGNTGQFLFSILKWLCFAFVCSTGMFLTSDTVSEEKREGTLGLLFLTDLRGYDVVLGKLVATSLKAFYGLLAFFPVLGLTLMAGGVSGTEFWRTVVALCNALFFSLATGVVVSTFSRDTLKALSGVMAFCFIALAAPPLLDFWRANWDGSKMVPKFMFASPAYAFTLAPQRSARLFWLALLAPHITAWLCLGLASFFVPRTWQEKSTDSQKKPFTKWLQRLVRDNRRTYWLERNPMVWLAGRDRWVTYCAQIVFLGFGGLIIYLWWALEPNELRVWIGVISSILVIALYIWVTTQATRFLSDSRRNGALELILCTPISVSEVIRGQWMALLRMTWLPMLVILALSAFQQMQLWAQLKQNLRAASSSTTQSIEIFQMVSEVMGMVTFVTTTVALGWFGMLMGLRSRKTSMALVKTIVLVQVLPWLAVGILQGLLMMATMLMKIAPYWTGVLAGLIFLIKDMVFIFGSRRGLYRIFREAAAEATHSVKPAKAPRIPVPVNPNVPPIVPA